MSKTITMPLEQYSEMVAKIEAIEKNGFYAKRTYNYAPLSFKPYWCPKEATIMEITDEQLCKILDDNEFVRKANKELSDSLLRIPSFIRKIFGA